MPFISEEELLSLQKEIQDANDLAEELENEKEDLEIEKEEIELNLSKCKKKSVITNTIFGGLAGAVIALSLVMLSGDKKINLGFAEDIDVDAIKTTERNRVIDSLSTIMAANTKNTYEEGGEDEEYNDDFDAKNSSEDLKDGLENQLVYSVQIGVFPKKKYQVLSKTLAGIATKHKFFKYSVGIFNSVEEAREFRLELLEIGFKDAFIASYVNGKRRKIIAPE